ncbi:hypothetical protein NEOKW01_1717 [Nematocida sp. AWRm80]|nr:hypothetical protein NEOKW01_1717 [Nematocida sp. AWRm80]
MDLPPIFHEETLPTPSGEITIKLFLDRENNRAHIFAVQPGAIANYSAMLSKKIKKLIPTRKIHVLCYLSSSEEVSAVKSALHTCLNRILY